MMLLVELDVPDGSDEEYVIDSIHETLVAELGEFAPVSDGPPEPIVVRLVAPGIAHPDGAPGHRASHDVSSGGRAPLARHLCGQNRLSAPGLPRRRWRPRTPRQRR